MSTSKQPAARPAAKAGPPKAAKPGGSAKPASTGEPVYVEPPRSIGLAVRLMYAGAVMTAVGVVADAIQIMVSKIAVPAAHHAAHQPQASKSALIASVVLSGLIEIGLWVFMARANRAGLSWARIVASALAAISTVLLVVSLLHGSAVSSTAFMALTWLVGAGACYYLWRRESSVYFTTPAAPSPTGASGPASRRSGP